LLEIVSQQEAVSTTLETVLFQYYLHIALAGRLNTNIFMGTENVTGSIVIELGYAEMYSLRSCGQDQSTPSDLPAQDGCVLYQLLTESNNFNLENLTVDMFGVSFEKRSALKYRRFHRFTGM
jgi:hypothetical protein